ncbi:hypothetical protein [Clostridium botulinum]|uniref:hypothetical protein n=1 Tax=Clostridium botulinum TaxID=1491 RepID=UPI001C9B32CB|nr:hypothetical protein [Clostridium botulinum]MBY6837829.1 hypothetical protein [Clostridium botulinum]
MLKKVLSRKEELEMIIESCHKSIEETDEDFLLSIEEELAEILAKEGYMPF